MKNRRLLPRRFRVRSLVPVRLAVPAAHWDWDWADVALAQIVEDEYSRSRPEGLKRRSCVGDTCAGRLPAMGTIRR